MTCPSVSSFFSLLATRLYAAVCFVFLIIGVIILIFWAEVKPGNTIFYKKVSGAPLPMQRNAPDTAATRPLSEIETYSTFGIIGKIFILTLQKPPDMSMLKSQPGSCSVPSASVKYVSCRSLIARSITAASPTFAAA